MNQSINTTAFDGYISSLQKEINDALARLPLSTEPDYLYDPVRYVLQGKGKRLRPILVHLVGTAYDADPKDLLNAGLAVELLHNFTLVHDDIMDSDDLRHGQPTVHKTWDESTAILAGDGIYALAQLLMARVKVNPLDAVRAFNKATLVVCEGQAYDKQFENDQTITLSQYISMIEKKTGWLLGLCARLGGIIGNRERDTNERLHTFGLNLGKVFQIQDDILEIFSESKSMGKSLGSDLIAGKQTVLTVLAREDNPQEWLATYKKLRKDKLVESIIMLRHYLEDKGILARAMALAGEAYNDAQKDLQIIPPGHKDQLVQFAEMVLNRKK